MSKIHPSRELKEKADEYCMLTVWKRSSMSFQGTDGFTVFDHHGRLVFRVDNYSRNHRSVTVLMDGAGNALLSLKPQILSMQYQWNAYREEEDVSGKSNNKVFSMKSSSRVFFNGGNNNNNNNNDYKAEVYMGSSSSSSSSSTSSSSSGDGPDFRIEGSFRSRNCKIRNGKGEVVAKIERKKVMNSTVMLSDDVFSLIIQPSYSSELIMAFVIILDRISTKPYTPVFCS